MYNIKHSVYVLKRKERLTVSRIVYNLTWLILAIQFSEICDLLNILLSCH